MRVSVFIDGANLYFTQRHKLRWWIDYKKLYDYLESFGDIVNCIYYTGLDAPPETRQKNFLNIISDFGFSVEKKTIKKILQHDGSVIKKANLDIELVLDMFNQIDNYDLAVLMSGDGDFERPLDLLKARGKQFRVLSTSGIIATELKHIAGNNYIDLKNLRSDLEKT